MDAPAPVELARTFRLSAPTPSFYDDPYPTYRALREHDPQFFGVQSDDYVDEWNLIADWSVTPHLSLSLVGALAIPGDGATEYFGDDENWTAGMVMATVRY